MTEFILQYGFSNLVIAFIIGSMAWAVQVIGKRPMLAHLLWVLVLLKLVTPPLLNMPVVSSPSFGTENMSAVAEYSLTATGSVIGEGTIESLSQFVSWKTVAAAIWILGSACILIWSVMRIARFSRLLRLSSHIADADLQLAASIIARDLGLKTHAVIYTTEANISPMVWWIGGRVRIYLPSSLTERMQSDELRWVLAHELGHVHRGDHFVRGLEWLVCVTFWWNPVAWWARRNLRINEEVCCDALVLATLQPSKTSYASSLVTALEILAKPIVRPPAMASAMIGGGFLERRLKMIVSKKSIALTPRWLKNSVLVGAAILLPLGFSLAQETGDYERVSRWLEAGINAAELTQEQADIMLRALRASESSHLISLVRSKAELVQQEEMIVELRARIEQAFESGEITEAQARTQLEELRFELHDGETITLVPVEGGENGPVFIRPGTNIIRTRE